MARESSLTGQSMFIHALRVRWPSLWRNLHAEVWLAEKRPDLIEWASKQGRGIYDEWLLGALLLTLRYWDALPESPDARLEPEHPWYYVPGLMFTEGDEPSVPDFDPKFEKPYPVYTAPTDVLERLQAVCSPADMAALQGEIQIEPLEDFEKRMETQFRTQLKEYIKLVRKRFDYGARDQMWTHAQWASLVLAGMDTAEIGLKWPGMSHYEDPGQAVYRAVNRFAKDIGLTLDCTRKRANSCT